MPDAGSFQPSNIFKQILGVYIAISFKEVLPPLICPIFVPTWEATFTVEYINRDFLLFLQKTNLAVAIFWGSDPATAQYARNKMALLKNDGVPFASWV